MGNFLLHLSFLDWLALGVALIILEIFGAGGYLLWTGIAATAVSALVFLLPGMSWVAQCLLFAVLCVVSATLWWSRQRHARPTDQPLLNQRGQELIGRVFVVQEAIVDGRGKIKVGDGLWLVRGENAAAGSQVRVIGQQDVHLLVERTTQAPDV
ncbi:NfeD family protein [Pseudomonas sp. dw_358]|uniref:NfeD family protein n=1 Tax=Pseudomonas sp. dw_358 TaxID=2720083 RepID=UPI001BD446E7|nr:NfeD family protein [Pseudomonas sp. dw_358]